MSEESYNGPPAPRWSFVALAIVCVGAIYTLAQAACLVQNAREKKKEGEQMEPEYFRTLRSHANMVQDRLDKALQMETVERKTEFEWAEREFIKRHPKHNWREWCNEERKNYSEVNKRKSGNHE